MKTKLLAAALAATLGTSVGAMATGGIIAIDPTGGGGAPGFEIDDIGMSAGYSLMDQLIPGGSSGTFYSQAHVRLLGNALFPNAVLTYQFAIDTSSTSIGSTGVIVGGPGVAGTFQLFFDPDSTDGTIGTDRLVAASGDGIGYGTMNGATGALGQVKLLEATITMQAGVALNQDIVDASFYYLSQNQESSSDPQQVATINWQGAGNFTIDVTTQDRSYVVNEMVGASATLEDIQLLGQGNSAPFQTNNRPTNIVGESIVASDYGVAQTVTVQKNFPDPAASGPSSTITVPVNDASCNAGFGVTCIATFQTSGTLDFKGPSATSEPSLVGLLGLGLVMTGFIGARRRSRQA